MNGGHEKICLLIHSNKNGSDEGFTRLHSQMTNTLSVRVSTISPSFERQWVHPVYLNVTIPEP